MRIAVADTITTGVTAAVTTFSGSPASIRSTRPHYQTANSLFRLCPARPADCPHLAALSSTAEEPVATIGLESRNLHSGRHLQLLDHLTRSWIDSSHIALLAFPGAVPKFSIDPG